MADEELVARAALDLDRFGSIEAVLAEWDACTIEGRSAEVSATDDEWDAALAEANYNRNRERYTP